MVNQPLLDYISKNLSIGHSNDEVTSTLLEAGWKKEDVDEAFVYLASSNNPSKVSALPEIHNNQVGKNWKRKLLVFEVIISVLIFFSASIVSLIALDKISLPDAKLQEKISFSLMKIPFFPKTPKYIISESINVQKKVTRSYIDISLAVDAGNSLGGLNQLLGKSSFDIAVKGPVDITDPLNPLMSLNMAFAKDLSLDMMMKNKIVYIKINSLPQTLLALAGLDSGKFSMLLDKWIYYDISPIETQARKNLDDYAKTNPENPDMQLKALSFLSDKKLLSYVKITDDKIDSFNTYKFDLPLTKEVLDYLQGKIEKEFNVGDKNTAINKQEKLSDYIEGGSIALWFDKKEYYLRQLKFMAKINTPKTSGFSTYSMPMMLNAKSNGSYSISLVLKQSDFGKPFDVSIPQNALTLEEATKLFYESMSSSPLLNPVGMVDKSKFTRAIADIDTLKDAVLRFHTSKGRYPETVNDLIKEGELNNISKQGMEESMVYYLLNKSDGQYLIYTLTPDPSSTASPFLVITEKDGTLIKKNYSLTDLSELTNSFSGKIMPTIVVTVAPTMK